jgi:hypothetical protein
MRLYIDRFLLVFAFPVVVISIIVQLIVEDHSDWWRDLMPVNKNVDPLCFGNVTICLLNALFQLSLPVVEFVIGIGLTITLYFFVVFGGNWDLT